MTSALLRQASSNLENARLATVCLPSPARRRPTPPARLSTSLPPVRRVTHNRHHASSPARVEKGKLSTSTKPTGPQLTLSIVP